MRAEVQYSIVQNKFQEWFENPVPGDIPILDEVDESIEIYVPNKRIHLAKAKPSRHKTRKRKIHSGDSTELLALLFFGLMGAISFGLGAGIIFLNLNLNFERWYNPNWPSQSFFIVIAAVFGFNFGLFLEYAFLQRDR